MEAGATETLIDHQKDFDKCDAEWALVTMELFCRILMGCTTRSRTRFNSAVVDEAGSVPPLPLHPAFWPVDFVASQRWRRENQRFLRGRVDGWLKRKTRGRRRRLVEWEIQSHIWEILIRANNPSTYSRMPSSTRSYMVHVCVPTYNNLKGQNTKLTYRNPTWNE